MRILLVQDTDWLQRGPHQQHHILERLSLRGHEVTVVDFPLLWRGDKRRGLRVPGRDVEDVARFYEGARVRLVRPSVIGLPWIDKASILATYRRPLRRLVRDWRPDVVIGMGILTDRIARRLARAHGIPYVAFLIDALHQLLDIRPLHALARRWEADNLRAADTVFVINQALADYAVRMGAAADKVSVIPSGVDAARVASGDRGATRRSLGIAPGAVVMLFMGWLYPFSGVDRVAQAILDSTNEVHLLVVGGGDLEVPLRSLAARDPRGRIIVTGWQPFERMPDYLAAADVCILPSDDNETMRHIVPIKLYEYIAAGKPVLTTPIASIMREFEGQSAVKSVADPQDFPKQAVRLHGTMAGVASKTGRRFRKDHAWDAIVERFEQGLEAVVPLGGSATEQQAVTAEGRR